jgi:hypothetical protein
MIIEIYTYLFIQMEKERLAFDADAVERQEDERYKATNDGQIHKCI